MGLRYGLASNGGKVARAPSKPLEPPLLNPCAICLNFERLKNAPSPARRIAPILSPSAESCSPTS